MCLQYLYAIEKIKMNKNVFHFLKTLNSMQLYNVWIVQL